MLLQKLGWSSFFDALLGNRWLVPARVIAHGGDRYLVHNGSREMPAVVRGRLREQAAFPPVAGDWVGLAPAEPNRGIADSSAIEEILERRTAIVRRRAGRTFGAQVLAANVDRALLVMALDQDFNLRRLERYLTLVWESGATPLIVLSKADLAQDPAPLVREAEKRALGFPVICLSCVSGQGLDQLKSELRSGETVVLLGSSGVGKSTLINHLAGTSLRQTGTARASDGKGRHTTTDRHLLCLPSGVLVIDTPGLREVQLWAEPGSLDETFSEIKALASGCRFRDCRHRGEPGCAVAAAIEQGEIDRERLESFLDLQAELEHLQRQSDPRLASEYKSEVKKLHRAQKQLQRMSKKP
jgi:ribosome biogenesis GTPase